VLEIINWLIDIEEMARDLYRNSSIYFQENKKFSNFLSHLANDEAWHYDIMRSASVYEKEEKIQEQFITLDQATKEKVEQTLIINNNNLLMKNLTIDSLLDCIIKTEYSEWNHLFLYVINKLKNEHSEFLPVASKMQDHILRIEDTLKSLPEGQKYLEQLRQLPEVWKKKILIVEKYKPIVIFLIGILGREGIIDTAENGEVGLSKVKNSYFDVIISDTELPNSDGIAFYQKASKIDPKIGESFIFIVSSSSEELINYLNNNNLKYIQKPIPIQDTISSVNDKMFRTLRA
jgi:CheY-like chemotaxis protein/rubrerythrin